MLFRSKNATNTQIVSTIFSAKLVNPPCVLTDDQDFKSAETHPDLEEMM